MFDKNLHYCLKDTAIVPADMSTVEHRRTDCNPFDTDGMLKLFTSPMLNVVGSDTIEAYKANHIHPIYPRTEPLDLRYLKCHTDWCAFGLSEFQEHFLSDNLSGGTRYVLIDVANGNMKALLDSIRTCKKTNPNVIIMAGNVANPKTYRLMAEAGADYIRLSVGTGSACTTSSNTAIHYPMASLIDECYQIKKANKYEAKIIADGGIKNYNDIIKCYALGADYVMCGNVFNRMLEASGDVFYKQGDKYVMVDNENIKKYYDDGVELYREYFGMSTKRAQKEMGVKTLHTGEGRGMINKIEYTMSGWVENFTDYLRSSMSYCDVRDINDFNPENVNVILISENSYNSYNR